MIYSAPISQPDGASKVVSSFVKNKCIFRDYGVIIDTYAPQGHKGQNTEQSVSFRSRLKRLVFKTDIAGVIRISYDYFVRGKKAIELYNIEKKGNYDAIIFHEPATCYNYIRRKHNERIILVVHSVGDFFSTSLIEFPLLKYTLFYNVYLSHVKRKILRNVDKIVFNSELAVNNFYSINPCVSRDLATFVDNGIEDFVTPENHIHHSKLGYNFVCVGNIVERKGQSFIVDAIAEMTTEELYGIKICFVGDGIMRQTLENKVHELGLDSYITFKGVQKDVVPYLDQANVFILPSMVEGMPVSIIEAMRSALPVISTRVGGIPYQVIDGVNGFLIDASKEGVKQILKNIKRYDLGNMGEKSRERYLAKFSLDQTIKKYSDLIMIVCE